MSKKNKTFLSYGHEGQDENFLVATEEGLEHLIKACQTTIENGKYDGQLADFIGIRKVEDSYFLEKPQETLSDKVINSIFIPLVLLFLGSSFLVGFFTIISWFI